ncbi:MAG: hypothetical protein ACYCYO_16240 [Bacilli bacterium]
MKLGTSSVIRGVMASLSIVFLVGCQSEASQATGRGSNQATGSVSDYSAAAPALAHADRHKRSAPALPVVKIRGVSYRLPVSRSADLQLFRYVPVKGGIVWVMPMPVKPSRYPNQFPTYLGSQWKLYFTPMPDATRNLSAHAHLIGEVPVVIVSRYGLRTIQTIWSLSVSGSYVLVDVINYPTNAAQGFDSMYDANLLHPYHASLTELTTYTPGGGGVFTRTQVLPGYFVAVVEEPSPVWNAMRAFANISILATGKTVFVRLPAYKQFPNNSRWPSVEMEGHSIVFLYDHHVLARYPTH